jgi:hypothetical protein
MSPRPAGQSPRLKFLTGRSRRQWLLGLLFEAEEQRLVAIKCAISESERPSLPRFTYTARKARLPCRAGQDEMDEHRPAR